MTGHHTEAHESRNWPSATERLRERTVVTDSGCWEYRGGFLHLGYGVLRKGGRNIRAHRLAYELEYGPIPRGAMILHSCDNRACVNPEHLRIGTHAENMVDRKVRGRTAVGERCRSTRLTPALVREIRRRHEDGEGTSVLALEYGVTDRSILHVVTRSTWRHVT